MIEVSLEVMVSEVGEWGKPPAVPEVSVLIRGNIHLAKVIHLSKGDQREFKLNQQSWPTLQLCLCSSQRQKGRTSQGSHEHLPYSPETIKITDDF